jgi:hypothetical protein
MPEEAEKMIKQISLLLENKKGQLSRVCRILGDAGVNIRALSIADTSDFGILRLIVNDPQQAELVLKEKGILVRIAQVLALKIADEPGGLAVALEKLFDAGINVEYSYAFIGKSKENAMVIIRPDDMEKAVSLMQNAGISALSEEEVYNL